MLGAARSCCILTAAADLDIERLGLALLEVTRRRYGVFPEVGLAGSLMSPSTTRPLASAPSVSEGCTANSFSGQGGDKW